MSGIAEVLLNLGYRSKARRFRERQCLAVAGKGALVHIAMTPSISARRKSSWSRPRSSANNRNSSPAAKAPAHRSPAEMLAELMRLKHCVAIAGRMARRPRHPLSRRCSKRANSIDRHQRRIINAYGTNARLGSGDWMVVEADESDGTFLKLPAESRSSPISIQNISIISGLSRRSSSLPRFCRNIPFMASRHVSRPPTVRELAGKIEDRRVITYGRIAGRRQACRRRS